LQRLPTGLSAEKSHEEDLSEQIYYSDDEDVDNLSPVNAAAAAAVDSSPHPQPTDNASLLSQLLCGGLASQATIELAYAQLIEALTADEKPLTAQLVQQLAVMNPLLATANPLALQVEAIRMILTTRGQRALMPAVQQIALEAQLQNLPQSGSSPGMTAPAAEPTRIIAHQATVNPQEDRHSQTEVESTHSASVSRHENSTTAVDTARVPRRPGPRPARGRGRGMTVSGDNETCRPDWPRGRGIGRGRSASSVADETHSLSGNSSAAVSQPLVPPPSLTAEPVREPKSRSRASVNSLENWEEEIDEFGGERFNVRSSFFKCGKR